MAQFQVTYSMMEGSQGRWLNSHEQQEMDVITHKAPATCFLRPYGQLRTQTQGAVLPTGGFCLLHPLAGLRHAHSKSSPSLRQSSQVILDCVSHRGLISEGTEHCHLSTVRSTASGLTELVSTPGFVDATFCSGPQASLWAVATLSP